MAREILELLGNKFSVDEGKYKICPHLPNYPNHTAHYTRDRYTNEAFCLLIPLDNNTNYVMVVPSRMGFYLEYKLNFIEYIESADIRKEWKYGKRKIN